MKKLSFRGWISIITFILIGVILFFSRKELHRAWGLLGRVDWWILILLLPVILAGYLAAGEMIFSYLRQKGYIKEVHPLILMRVSLELNFVNHILPSGGVSGISYMNWRLGGFGVPAGKATMAQVVRYACGFVDMVALLLVAVLLVTIDGTVNRWIILMSSTLVSVMIFTVISLIYIFSSRSRMHRLAHMFVQACNKVVYRVTFGKVPRIIQAVHIIKPLDDMHDDYVALRRDKRVLIRPLLWGVFFTMTEIAIFWIVFWALGSSVNPAPILIAYGLASLAGFIVVTPGGAGAYEAIMVFVLAIAGMPNGEAIAGIILTRAIVLSVTIVVGWILYQQAVIRYGKRTDTTILR